MNPLRTRAQISLLGLSTAALMAWSPSAHAVPLDSETVADVAEKVTPAVVNINTERNARMSGHSVPPGHPFFHEFMGPRGRGSQPRAPRERGLGSGVVISPDGYIVTNNHVIDGADTITVTFTDKREFEAKLIGSDKASDVALIKIKGKSLPHLKFADSSKIRLGEFVLAIGNPFGVGQTLTMGIVSAKGRANVRMFEYEDFIQTDAAINPGNSGGALVDLEGNLVGINTLIFSKTGSDAGIGFAIPSNMIKPILKQIREHGRVRRGWLGVAIQDLNPDLAASLDLEGVKGVLISDVLEDGPADSAGLQPGDVVTHLDGNVMKSSAQFRNKIALLGPGTTARLSVIRNGDKKRIKVKLDEKKDDEARASAPEASDSPFAGLRLEDLDEELRDKLEAPKDLEGVLITEVVPGSPAERAGLRPGDVLTRIDKKRVSSIADIKRMNVGKKDRVLLRVWRGGSYLFLVLRN